MYGTFQMKDILCSDYLEMSTWQKINRNLKKIMLNKLQGEPIQSQELCITQYYERDILSFKK